MASRKSIDKGFEETKKSKRLLFFAKENLSIKAGQLLAGCFRVVVCVFFGAVAWRIAWSNWSVDLSKFDFSDLLALIMAIFAIGMSVAFYFKATDTSNKFYDNVYKFTQETSEILGRIEAGFGERLRHLDEGYSGLQTRFDQFSSLTPEENKEKVERNREREVEAKAKLQEADDEKQQIFDTLAKRAKLAAQEKTELFDKLKLLEEKNNDAEMRLRKLQRERNRMREEMQLMQHNMPVGMTEVNPYIRELVSHPKIRHLILGSEDMPFEIIQGRFRELSGMLPRDALVKLFQQGILSKNGKLTLNGYALLKTICRQHE